jgi:hypothetical protein
LKLIDMGRAMSTVIAPALTETNTGPVAPRVRRLAPLSCVFVDVELEQFGVEFLVDNVGATQSTQTIISTALKGYGALVQGRGRHAFVSLSRRAVVLQQLRTLGVCDAAVVALLQGFESDVVESRHDVGHTADAHTLGLFQQPPTAPKTATHPPSTARTHSNGLRDALFDLPTQTSVILFDLQLSGLRLIRHGLTYDSRTLLTLRSATLYDNDRVALFSMARELSERLEHFPHLDKDGSNSALDDILAADVRGVDGDFRSSRKRESYGPGPSRRDSATFGGSGRGERPSSASGRRSSSASRRKSRRSDPRGTPTDRRRQSSGETLDPQAERAADPYAAPRYLEYFQLAPYVSESCVVLKYDERDAGNGFGEGGWGISALYSSIDATKYAVRDGNLVVSGCQVNVQLSTNSILQITEQAVKAATVVTRHIADEDASPQETADAARRGSVGSGRRRGSLGSRVRISEPRVGVFARDRKRRSTVALMGTYREKPTALGANVYVHQYQRKLSLKGEWKAVSVVLSCEQQYLSKLSFYRIALAVQDVTNFERSRACTSSIHSLSVLDFSDLGALHGEVLWKKNDNQSLLAVMEGIKQVEKDQVMSATAHNGSSDYLHRESHRRQAELFRLERARIEDAPPVIVFSLTQTDTVVDKQRRHTTSVHVEIDSLRVCLLFRFFMELSGYVSDKLVAPLTAMLHAMEEDQHRQGAVPPILKVVTEDEFSHSSDSSGSDSDGGYSSEDFSGSSQEEEWSGHSSGSDHEFHSASPSSPTAKAGPEQSSGPVPMVLPTGVEGGTESEIVTSFEVTVSFTELSCLIPRNSNSRDLVGLKVGSGSVTVGYVKETFPTPEKGASYPGLYSGESDAHYPLHMDVATNEWRYKPSMATQRVQLRAQQHADLDTCTLRSVSTASATPLAGSAPNTGRMRARTSSALGEAAFASGHMDDGHVFYDADAPQQEWSATYDHSPLKDWREAESRVRSSVSGGIAGCDESFWWPPDEHEDRERRCLLEDLAATPPPTVYGPKDCHRIGVVISDARIYVTFAGPSNYSKDGQRRSADRPRRGSDAQHYTFSTSSAAAAATTTVGAGVDTTEHKVYVEIEGGGLVNKFRRKAMGVVGVWPINQAWKEVTAEPCNVLVLYDTMETKTKMLFGDTADMSTLHLNVSQSELYLLIGVWFDNIFERPQFGQKLGIVPAAEDDPPVQPPAPPSPRAETAAGQRESRSREPVRFNLSQPADSREAHGHGRRHTNSGGSATADDAVPGTPRRTVQSPPHYQMYGSKDYIRFIRERIGSFELVLMRAEVRLQCSLDTNYFAREIPNHAAVAHLEPAGSGTAFCYHMHHHHHHHHGAGHRNTPHGVGASSGKLPKGANAGDDGHRSVPNSSMKGGRGTGEEKMSFSFYNIPTDQTPSSSKRVLYSRWVNKLLPLADISFTGMMAHIQSDDDATHFSLGTGKCEMYDMRNPHQIAIPLALRLAPADDPTSHEHVHQRQRAASNETKRTGTDHRRLYGYSDFNFGFDLLPSEMYLPPDLPLKVSYIQSEETNWMTCNVGMDLLDLNIHNLDITLLVGDFFSCYFRFPEYGHPGIQAYERLTAPYVIPYGGVDTRVFVYRPHISLMKSPLNIQSPGLLLETEGGVYFRYTLDTENTVKMDLNIYSLAVILVKRYRPPSQYRGVRGASGSGKGVRTLIEFLNIAMAYHFVVSQNRLDFKLLVSGPDEESDDEDEAEDTHAAAAAAAAGLGNSRRGNTTSYVDLHGEQLRLGSSAVPHPHSVYPLVPSRTDFTPLSCDIVTSYEDLTFCMSLINKFLQLDAVTTAQEPDGTPEMKQSGSAKHTPDADSQAPSQSNSFRSRSRSHSEASDASVEPGPQPCAIFSVVVVAGVRLMIVDNVLGLHLPLVQVRVCVYYDASSR